jgi:hypothetical protein
VQARARERASERAGEQQREREMAPIKTMQQLTIVGNDDDDYDDDESGRDYKIWLLLLIQR